MTTATFNHTSSFSYAARAPRVSFAARLAALQARQEHQPAISAVAAFAACGALALIPFSTLAWMFASL